MEIKVAESWTLEQLSEALHAQLIGRYLRDRTYRWGILLLVHQRRRQRGWAAADGRWLSFDQVVSCLREQAYRVAAGSPDAAQVEIAVIDVSTVSPRITAQTTSQKRRGRSKSKAPLEH